MYMVFRFVWFCGINSFALAGSLDWEYDETEQELLLWPQRNGAQRNCVHILVDGCLIIRNDIVYDVTQRAISVSYHTLQIRRFVVMVTRSLWNLTDISPELLPRPLSYCRRPGHYTNHSRRFRTFIKMTSYWAWWRLKSPASPLFAQLSVRVQIKKTKNIKAQRHWLLCREFTGDRWIPHAKVSNAENVSNWWRQHGVIIR